MASKQKYSTTPRVKSAAHLALTTSKYLDNLCANIKTATVPVHFNRGIGFGSIFPLIFLIKVNK